MGQWRLLERRVVQRCRVFDVSSATFESVESNRPHQFFVLNAPDWVNVIPITDGGRVLMVRQYRFGIAADTLEIPGGMCDAGESPLTAARRELREETGYRAKRLTGVGWVHPNPPIQDNRCHTFVARGLSQEGPPSATDDERIELIDVALDELPRLLVDGTITHALVLAAFQLFDGYRRGFSRQDGA
ncbi:MAG TPA: NUDIX hydrolase [Candidatus Polarisedimenticolaceae bacterium]|nr:NUDIX hydrolase [Candidatus Polarisedimenticolaceae bacterium]